MSISHMGCITVFNVVARNKKFDAGAVLIRSIEPQEGVEFMKKNRKITDLKNLTNGPAKVTQALKHHQRNIMD